MKSNKKFVLDIIGVGVGPFNLGLAALLNKINKLDCLFLEKKIAFSWHEDMMLNNSKLQVHYLKDLVTLVDPTNKFSFLQYLVECKRVFQFIHRKEQLVSREEFNHYFIWASKKMNNIIFNSNVQSILYKKNRFIVKTATKTYFAKNIVIGTGISPYIPLDFKNSLSNSFFHSSGYITHKSKLDFSNKKIAIIGGGQSGAEIFDDILSHEKLPSEIAWITERSNFYPLEDACFSNEFYSPSYTKYFYTLPYEARIKKLNDLAFTSDGITVELANLIYNKIYEFKFIKKININFCLLLKHYVRAVTEFREGFNLEILNLDKNIISIRNYDIVILATGYRCLFPDFLNPIFPKIKCFEDLELNEDYSVKWPNQNKIFIQGGFRHQFGIADANLSLATYRNATIINSLMNKIIYNTNNMSIFNNELI